MQVLHIADVQLGAQFKSLGDKAKLQRDQIKKTFHKVLEFCVEEKIKLIIVSGDLFDSNSPSQELVSFIKGEFDYLKENDIEICIIPGHHDALEPHGIYTREKFDDEFENIFIFRNPNGEVKEYLDKKIAVFAKPNISATSTLSPLPDISKFDTNAEYKILASHGDLQIPGKSSDNYHPIALSEIEKLKDIAYVALGHWHSMKDCSKFGKFSMPVFYAGSPELVDIDQQGAGNVIVVTLADGKASASVISVGARKSLRITISISDFQNQESLKKKIAEFADANTLLRVDLEGLNINNVFVNTETIEEELADKFFHIQIVNKSEIAIDEFPDYSDKLIQGQFVKILREKIKSSKDESEKKIYENALQVGLAELEGRPIIH